MESRNYQASLQQGLLRPAIQQTSYIAKKTGATIAAIALVASAFFLGAVPAHAASSPFEGSIYTQAAGSGTYKTRDKLACPNGASLITDCKLMLEFSGPGYESILKPKGGGVNMPSGGSTDEDGFPIGVFATVALDYDAEHAVPGLQRRTLLQVVPVSYDAKSKKIFGAVDLSKFYFDNFADPKGPYAWGLNSSYVSGYIGADMYGGTDGWTVTTGGYIQFGGMTSGSYECGDYLTDGSIPKDVAELFMKDGRPAMINCLFMGEKFVSNSVPYKGQVFNEDTAASSLIGIEVNLFKAPVMERPTFDDGILGFLIGPDNENGLAVGDNKSFWGFPNSEAQPVVMAETCAPPGSSGDPALPSQFAYLNYGGAPAVGLAGRLPSGRWKGEERYNKNSPSGQTVFQYVKETPGRESCFESPSMSNVYKAATVDEVLSDPSRVISWDEFGDIIENSKPVTPDTKPVFERPEFGECINMNPLDFKWDWPCVMESLFVATPASMDSMAQANQALMTRFPFSYLPVLFDASNQIMNPSGTCSPLHVKVGTASLPLITCDAGFRAFFRPITTWGFNLLIALVVGTWVLRKFMPGTPGER